MGSTTASRWSWNRSGNTIYIISRFFFPPLSHLSIHSFIHSSIHLFITIIIRFTFLYSFPFLHFPFSKGTFSIVSKIITRVGLRFSITFHNPTHRLNHIYTGRRDRHPRPHPVKTATTSTRRHAHRALARCWRRSASNSTKSIHQWICAEYRKCRWNDAVERATAVLWNGQRGDAIVRTRVRQSGRQHTPQRHNAPTAAAVLHQVHLRWSERQPSDNQPALKHHANGRCALWQWRQKSAHRTLRVSFKTKLFVLLPYALLDWQYISLISTSSFTHLTLMFFKGAPSDPSRADVRHWLSRGVVRRSEHAQERRVADSREDLPEVLRRLQQPPAARVFVPRPMLV